MIFALDTKSLPEIVHMCRVIIQLWQRHWNKKWSQITHLKSFIQQKALLCYVQRGKKADNTTKSSSYICVNILKDHKRVVCYRKRKMLVFVICWWQGWITNPAKALATLKAPGSFRCLVCTFVVCNLAKCIFFRNLHHYK